MPKFKIYAVRFSDQDYKEKIDETLIHSNLDYPEAIKIYERLLREAGFKEYFIGNVMKSLKRTGNDKNLGKHGSYIPDLYNLGPGGYILVRQTD